MEGSIARNSGYLVDTTLNDGFTSNKNLKAYKKKTNLYKEGIKSVRKFIKEQQIDCDWNECGKYFASSKIQDLKVSRSNCQGLKVESQDLISKSARSKNTKIGSKSITVP